jgi:anti-sigma regulatory factor (Ser/Thr protein kinase)
VSSWSRYFPGRADQVAQARLFVASVLAGRPEAEAAALVVSELSTNAVRHTASGGPDGLFAVTVRREDDRATVTVQDMGAAGEPAIRTPDADVPEESGRGLLLVAAVSKDWGAARNRLGWQVWAELASTGGE